jgi:hypothetical protein
MLKYKMSETLSYINPDYEQTHILYDNICNIYDIDKDYILAYIFNNKCIKSKIFKQWKNMLSFDFVIIKNDNVI